MTYITALGVGNRHITLVNHTTQRKKYRSTFLTPIHQIHQLKITLNQWILYHWKVKQIYCEVIDILRNLFKSFSVIYGLIIVMKIASKKIKYG